MSRQAKVRMADVLIAAGYNLRKVLGAIKYPTIESISFDGKFSVDGFPTNNITISLLDGEKGKVETATIDLGKNYPLKNKGLYSTITKLQHDGLCYFSIYYGGNTVLRNKYQSLSNDSVPVVPGYPVPKALMPSRESILISI